ncbi:MAG: hypothetical protein ACAI44_06855 [Candidatus Sericytochromatia bacterium]
MSCHRTSTASLAAAVLALWTGLFPAQAAERPAWMPGFDSFSDQQGAT